MDRFGASLAAAAKGRPARRTATTAATSDLAAEIVAERPELLTDGDAAMVEFRERGYRRQRDQQEAVLDLFRTHFDVWYSGTPPARQRAVQRGLDRLAEQGHLFESDGATWLRTTDFGDDKDRVLIKSDGEMTYFASDSAYYVDKRHRGFDINIYLLGADHHGYVNRLKALAACAGDDPEYNIEVLIGRSSRCIEAGRRCGCPRAGDIVTLEDLVEEVGVDAADTRSSAIPRIRR